MTTEQPQELIAEKKEDGKIWLITLNRPDKGNALTLDMMYDLEDTWKAYQNDEESRAAIITGAGDKAFRAGAELEGDGGQCGGRGCPKGGEETHLQEQVAEPWHLGQKYVPRLRTGTR